MRWITVIGKNSGPLNGVPMSHWISHFSHESFLTVRTGWFSHQGQPLQMLERTRVPTQTHTPRLDSGGLQGWDIIFLKEVKRLAGRRDVLRLGSEGDYTALSLGSPGCALKWAPVGEFELSLDIESKGAIGSEPLTAVSSSKFQRPSPQLLRPAQALALPHTQAEGASLRDATAGTGRGCLRCVLFTQHMHVVKVSCVQPPAVCWTCHLHAASSEVETALSYLRSWASVTVQWTRDSHVPSGWCYVQKWLASAGPALVARGPVSKSS